MTLEQLGFVEERIDTRILYKREKYFVHYYEYIEFDISFKEIDIINIDELDMMLLEAIYAKAKELFI